MSDKGSSTLLFLCIRRKSIKKNILVKNFWGDLEIIWQKWSLGDPLPKFCLSKPSQMRQDSAECYRVQDPLVPLYV